MISTRDCTATTPGDNVVSHVLWSVPCATVSDCVINRTRRGGGRGEEGARRRGRAEREGGRVRAAAVHTTYPRFRSSEI